MCTVSNKSQLSALFLNVRPWPILIHCLIPSSVWHSARPWMKWGWMKMWREEGRGENGSFDPLQAVRLARFQSSLLIAWRQASAMQMASSVSARKGLGRKSLSRNQRSSQLLRHLVRRGLLGLPRRILGNIVNCIPEILRKKNCEVWLFVNYWQKIKDPCEFYSHKPL